MAVNIVANRSIAEIQDSAQLTNPGAVSLAASGVYAVDTEAEAGATGGVAITPVLALALVNNTTSARLGIGSDLVNPGAVSITADHTSSTTTSAKGSTQGDKAAIGAAVGVVLLNDVASADDRPQHPGRDRQRHHRGARQLDLHEYRHRQRDGRQLG